MEASGGYKLKTGAKAPAFSLPGVDGAIHALPEPGAPFVVAFWCNHCPYVRAYEARFVEWARGALAKGVRVVAINANDEVNYPEDDLPHMVARAKDHGYPFPYLRDVDQSVARAYGGVCTPHFMVFDSDLRLAYQGRFDDNKDDVRAVKQRYLPDVVDALLAGNSSPLESTWAIGCSIKWSA